MGDARAAVAVALLLALSGCVASFHSVTGTVDPPADVEGWEAGYWYDEALDVTTEDGLNETELEAVVARTMARVEVIRNLEFREEVPVEVISRAEYRERNVFSGNRSADVHDRRNQLWEALFLVGEDENASDELAALYGGSVVGYYTPAGNKIVLVTDEDDGRVMVDRATLAHELVHALQDQHFQLGFGRRTLDGRMAASGLTEGDANFVKQQYERKCQKEWSCLDRPPRSVGNRNYDVGMFVALFVPYSDGPTFVEHRFAQGRWRAVDATYDHPPNSTEQIIHPDDYPDDTPASVIIENRSSPAWERVTVRNRSAERVGEASLFAMLWANGVVPDDALADDDRRSAYDYVHPASTGWEGDALVAYRNGNRSGYVFRTTWETERDAIEFANAYRQVLEAHDATDRGDGVYRVPDSNTFGDAFRVTRENDTVTVVNAPTVDDLDDVHDS